MVFRLATTFANPGGAENSQRGFPAPGSGAQNTGAPGREQMPSIWKPRKPTQGSRTWGNPDSAESSQRGFPTVLNWLQRRPAGSMPNDVPSSGMPQPVWTPYYSRGANAVVQNFGKVLTNPIGAGVVARYRPMASYGPAAEYQNGAIFFAPQNTPTSIPTNPLSDAETMLALLGPENVQAVVPTTF